MRNNTRVLVTGAGGFIGHHLVRALKEDGYWIRGVDIKSPEFEASPADEFEVLDLRNRENCVNATHGFHNVYGPMGTYEGGKEKAPAAISRKVSLAEDGGEIEVWGDGQQTRSFMYVDDCVEGLRRLMASDYREPLNLGTDELITVNALVDLISKIAGKTLRKVHDPSKPQGVRGRNSDNSRLGQVLAWGPSR